MCCLKESILCLIDMNDPTGTYIITKEGFPVIKIYCETETDEYGNILYHITTGSDKTRCVNILIYPLGYNLYGIDKSHTANMCWVEYDKNCSITHDLQKGSGTKHLLYATLQFIRDYFKDIRTIELDDGSYFMCDNPFSKKEKSFKVMLRFYNIALHGESWYELVAKARLQNELEKDYIERRERFKDPTFKIDWIVFRLKYNIRDTDGNIEKAYRKTTTYQDFLKELRKHENEYCWYVLRWIEQFVNDILGNIPLNKWTITIDNLPIYSIKTTLQATTGGYKKKQYKTTHKQRKHPPGFNATEFDLMYKDGFPYA